MENTTIIQVVKATVNKHLLPLHQLFNLSTGVSAVGTHHTPSQKMRTELTVNGELYILAKDDLTGEIEAYVGKIISVFDKKKHPVQYKKAAQLFNARYYNYQQYECIFLVENLTQINQQTVEYLLNNLEYFKCSKKFSLLDFFKTRMNQLYLKKTS